MSDDLTRKRAAIISFHTATADNLERQAMALFHKSGESRKAAGYAAAMTAEEVEKVYSLVMDAIEKQKLAKMQVSGKTN